MRWLWPLALSLAVAAAAAAAPGGPPAQRSRPRRGAEDEEAGGAQRYVPEARAELPGPLGPPAGPAQPAGGAPGGRRLRMRGALLPGPGRPLGAYAVLLLALAALAVGLVASLSVMCAVGHSRRLQSAWYALLASLALWDFLVLVLCLPVVVFQELAQRRLLGAASCRAVPFLEVSSLGVTTFSLCALGIDRFHEATSTLPRARGAAERCGSILAKLAVIWVGSMTLAAPELLLWQLEPAPAPAPAPGPSADAAAAAAATADACVMRPAPGLPESLYSLVLTYQHARAWWAFGCYFCLPLLFTAACQLAARRARGAAGRGRGHGGGGESRPGATLGGLAAVYALCTLPQHLCDLVAAQLAARLSRPTLALLALLAQLSAFAQAALAPALLLWAARPLGLAFRDCCCCCCCEEACGAAQAAPEAELKTAVAAAALLPGPRGPPGGRLPLGTPC